MADFIVESAPDDPYSFGMEQRVTRLEEDMQGVKAVLGRLEPMIVRIDATLAATLPHLATKAEIADLRGEMNEKFAAMDQKFDQRFAATDQKIVALDQKFEQRFAEMDQKFDQRFAATDQKIVAMDHKFEQRFAAMERKSDQQFATIDLKFAGNDVKFALLEAKIAELPTRTYMWAVLGVLITAYGAGLAALAVLK